jgi:hypothetical protein
MQAKLRDGHGLSAYILMELIRPAPSQSTLLRNCQWTDAEAVSELGIYGTFLRKGPEVLLNAQAGPPPRPCEGPVAHRQWAQLQAVSELGVKRVWLHNI